MPVLYRNFNGTYQIGYSNVLLPPPKLILNYSLINNSLNVANLTGLTTISTNPTGTHLFVTNNTRVYRVTFSDNTYNTTSYNTTSIGGSGYGAINCICVTNTNVYVTGGYLSIDGDTNRHTVCTGSLTGNTLSSYYATTYSARHINNVIWDLSNTLFAPSWSFISNPTDSYFTNSSGLLLFENKNSSAAASFSGFSPNVALTYSGQTCYSLPNTANACLDPTTKNIYLAQGVYGGVFPGTVRINQYNAIVRYNFATNTTTVLTPLSLTSLWPLSVYAQYNCKVIAASNSYVYSILESATPVLLATDGTNTQCNYIFRVNSSTGVISAMGSGANALIYNMIFDNVRNLLYVSGAFTTMNGTSYGYTACWDETRQTWNKLVTLNNTCTQMAYSSTYNTLFLSGTFTTVDGVACNGFCAVKIT